MDHQMCIRLPTIRPKIRPRILDPLSALIGSMISSISGLVVAILCENLAHLESHVSALNMLDLAQFEDHDGAFS